jgi:hypothetical protein
MALPGRASCWWVQRRGSEKVSSDRDPPWVAAYGGAPPGDDSERVPRCVKERKQAVDCFDPFVFDFPVRVRTAAFHSAPTTR